jgi:hypothetical protein
MSEIRAQDYFAVVPEWVVYADISNAAVRLYAVLARFANSQGRAWPSRRTLAELMNCSMSSIDRAKDELISVGALSVEHRTNPAGDPSSNLYTIYTHPHGKPAPSSPMVKGSRVIGGRGTSTGDALNKANMKQNQIGKPSPMTDTRPACPECLGKYRTGYDDGTEGLAHVWIATSGFGDKPGKGIYVVCQACDGTGKDARK